MKSPRPHGPVSPRAKAAIALVAVFLVGVGIGNLGHETRTKWKVIHDTETVTKTETQTVTKSTTPPECKDLVKYSKQVLRAGSQFDLTNSAVLGIMSELRIAVSLSDSNAANDLETRLRKLDSKTIGAIETLGEVKQPLLDAAVACNSGGKK